MSGSHAADKAEPNLTPILDMVFQLITFFMLVISFRATDFDKALVLPVVGSAAPAEQDAQAQYLILNVRSGGKLFVQGKEEPNIEGFLKFEAQRLQKALQSDSDESAESDKYVTVVIRADRSLRCEHLMRVIKVCKSNGLDRFDFMVLSGGQQQSG